VHANGDVHDNAARNMGYRAGILQRVADGAARRDAWLANPEAIIPIGPPPAQSGDPRRHHRLSQGAELMAKPVHSMVRVFDEAKSLDFYARAFGLEVADHLKFPDFALIYLRHPSSPFEVELTVNFDRNEPYSLGDGYGHLAVVVDDLDAEHSRFEHENLSPGPLRELKHDGRTLARFFFVADPDGYKIEVIQRGGRFD
jgi:lactoylglutathione lyase